MAISTCSGCGLVFNTTAAFDMHRVGSYGEAIYKGNGKNRDVAGYTKPQRRCLTEPEMLALGMKQNEKKLWTSGREVVFFAREKSVPDELEQAS